MHHPIMVQDRLECLHQGKSHHYNSSWNMPVRKQDLLMTNTNLGSRFYPFLCQGYMLYNCLEISVFSFVHMHENCECIEAVC